MSRDGWYPPGVTGNEWQIVGPTEQEEQAVLNTTHIFNKATLAARSRDDIGDNLHGLDIDELLAALRHELLRTPPASELVRAAWVLCIGIEVGKMLCDPATHLDND